MAMQMQPAAVVVPDKIPGQWYNHHHHPHQQQPLQLDERDGFLMWLRGEFAAANAMIDALCHHLRVVGEPGEYDGVVGSIQQRRCNWNPILHMQQYFPVAEVVYALQQVGSRRQQRGVGFEGGARAGGGGKEFRRGGRVQRGENVGREVNGKDLNNVYVKNNLNGSEKVDGGEKPKVEEKEDKKELDENSEVDSLKTKQGSPQAAITHTEEKTEVAGSCNEDGPEVVLQNHEVTPKTFVATEICDGKSVNIAEGIKLYEDLFDDSTISKLITLVNNMRAAGRKGQLQGRTFVVLKRPMKGHGREMIQLGVSIADAPPDNETAAGTSKDVKTEPIPATLLDVIERLLTEQVVSTKPDSCIIDIFNEGDHSQPHIWPQCYGRPVCTLFLTECEMSFSRLMTSDHPGDYRGTLGLYLSPGSILALQGRSADFTQHAIPSIRKQRILVTFTKSQPKRVSAGDTHRFHSGAAPPSHWVPPISRLPNHTRPVATKHYGPIPPTAGVRLPPPNSIQPIYVPAPVAPGLAFPAPVTLPPPATTGWSTAPQRHHPPPCLPVPGTGVFLPPQGSANSSNQTASPGATENITTEPSSGLEGNLRKSNGEVSEKVCNGGVDGEKSNSEKDEQENPEKEK